MSWEYRWNNDNVSRKMLAGFALTRLQIDNSLPDTRYPVLFGSPIHNPLFNNESATEVDRERKQVSALVNVRRGSESYESAKNQVLHLRSRLVDLPLTHAPHTHLVHSQNLSGSVLHLLQSVHEVPVAGLGSHSVRSE